MARTDWKKLAIHHSFNTLDSNGVMLRGLDLYLPKGQGLPLLKNYELAVQLKNQVKCQYTLDKDVLYARLPGDLSIEIQTAEEVFILHEIFVNNTYGYHFTRPSLVIDIGMNVGIASLYFANNERVESVYAFEPFTPTFKQAQENFKLNPEISQKITYHNFGLGAADRFEKVEYSSDHRGRVGLFGTDLVRDQEYRSEKQEIRIWKASKALDSVIERDTTMSYVMKMDCEGAEYEILPELMESGWLSLFSVVMLEWHGDGSEMLVELLDKAKFRVFRLTSTGNIGMIYAIK